MMLSTKNTVNAIHTASIGSLSSAIVHPREVYKAAVLANASSIVLGHNHPSGDPTPSPEDIEVTKRLSNAGDLMGIDVLDHVIIGDGRFYSLKERGLL
jgi:DNA repair protein RadC